VLNVEKWLVGSNTVQPDTQAGILPLNLQLNLFYRIETDILDSSSRQQQFTVKLAVKMVV
jgi:hypothetical protein